MHDIIWRSEPIQLSAEFAVDVHASIEGVTLGETAAHFFASDVLLKPEAAMELADALTQAAAAVLAATRSGK